MLMSKSRHTSLPSLAIYAKPTFDAVAAAHRRARPRPTTLTDPTSQSHTGHRRSTSPNLSRSPALGYRDRNASAKRALDGGGDRVEGGLGVDREAGQAGVPALGHQHREPDACFGEVGEPGVAELVQGPAAAGRGEYLGGSLVGRPGPAGGGVEVGQGWLAGRPSVPHRHRPRTR